MIHTIIRSQGGTKERIVHLSDIVVPDVPAMSTNDINEQWIASASKLRSDLIQILAALHDGTPMPMDLFVPNYWKAAIDLPSAQEAPMLELWHLAHDIGKAAFVVQYDNWRVDRDGVPGMLYHCQK